MVKWHSSRDGARQPCVVRSAVARRLSHGAPLSADWHHRCRVALPRATLDKQSKSSGCSEERRRLAWPCRADNGIGLSPAACHGPMRRRAAPRRLVPRPSRLADSAVSAVSAVSDGLLLDFGQVTRRCPNATSLSQVRDSASSTASEPHPCASGSHLRAAVSRAASESA